MNKRTAGMVTALEAETVGLQETLCWVEGFTVHQVGGNSDSHNVVNALQRNIFYRSEVGNTLESCLTKLQQRSDLIIQQVRK